MELSISEKTPPNKRTEMEVTRSIERVNNKDRMEGDTNRVIIIKIKVVIGKGDVSKEAGERYKEKLRNIKGTIRIEDENIVGVKRCFGSEDMLIRVKGIAGAINLMKKLREIGEEVNVLMGRRRKLHIQDIDAAVEDDEIKKEVSRRLRIDEEEIKVIYKREGFQRTQTTCVEVPENVLMEYLKNNRKLRTGWNDCRIREYVVSNKCYRCGKAEHRAVDCREVTEKRCYKCGEERHLVRQCNGVFKEREEDMINKVRGKPRDANGAQSEEMGDIRLNERGVRCRTVGVQVHMENDNLRIREVDDVLSDSDVREGWSEVVKKDRRKLMNKKESRKKEEGEEQQKTDMRRTKESIACPACRTGIKRIRGARFRSVLLEMEDDKDVGTWKEKITEVIRHESEGTVGVLGRRSTIKIRRIDSLVENREIIDAIIQSVGYEQYEEEQMKVVRIITEPWQENVAFIKVPNRMAEKLQEGEGIRIGWTKNKVRIVPNVVPRCGKCGVWGHRTEN
ncbi:unnamed protein product [Xylocopa violacea]|uniref:CCHC-type domain-containing protein n=1 Tax=Xylocopa violacea TaxID=135666 RepID=A0ABP1N0E7_XYLVO